MARLAILQVADTGPLESLVVMLRAVGYECALPDERLKATLRRVGCDTVLDVSNLVRGWGYDPPMPLPYAGVADMSRTDAIYVDVKGHRNGPLVERHWPNLRGRVLWYRINGGKPEHVIRRCDDCKRRNAMRERVAEKIIEPTVQQLIDTGILPQPMTKPAVDWPENSLCPRCEDCGDEVNPPCPVLTPNQWYHQWDLRHWRVYRDPETSLASCDVCKTGEAGLDDEACKSYTCWPPFVRFGDYYDKHQRIGFITPRTTASPICLIHNVNGWGYRDLVDPMRGLGVRVYGNGSPDGLINHSTIPQELSSALAMVHLKSSDAPGYAIYECLASACPLICTRRLIWRCRMEGLLVPGETCLVFDRETHEGLTPEDVTSCTAEVAGHLAKLKNQDYNRQIGLAGYNRLREVMWREDRDADGLRKFMRRNFG